MSAVLTTVLTAAEPGARYLAATAADLPAPLVGQFDLLATAPGGVARLRALILTLAVQGKLVPQQAGDEPAGVLLGRIRVEVDSLVAAKRIRRPKGSEPLEANAQDWLLPANWAWAQLGSLGDWGAGATPSRANSAYYGGSIPWFKSGELTADYISQAEETITEAALRDCSLRENQIGDVLIAMYGATIGKTAILATAGTTNQAVCACTPFLGLKNTYLLMLLKALKPYFISIGAGGAQPNISREKLVATVIGLPPLAEQARIVARVEELMHLCDALDAKGQLEAAQHAQLLGALLGTLADSASPAALAEHWQRVAAHFDLLLDRPEAVDALEQTVLQLAVRGLLVPQDPADTPAQISPPSDQAELRLLASERQGNPSRTPSEICANAHPFKMPLGWICTRVDAVVEMLNGYAFKSKWFRATGTRLLRNLNIGHGVLNWSEPAHIDARQATEFQAFALAEGDIVLTLDRPIISTGLKWAVVQHRDLPCFLLQRVARLSPKTTAISGTYLALWLQSDLFVGAIDPGRSNGVPHISTKQVASMAIGVPPLSEQTRIAARVTQLRQLCTDLRQRLAARQATQAQLAQALVVSAAG